MDEVIKNPLKYAKCRIIWSGLLTKDTRLAAPLAFGASACEYLSMIEDVLCNDHYGSAEMLCRTLELLNQFKYEVMEVTKHEQETQN